MKRQDFYFDLPEELIAQTPQKDRSSSRLLVLDKETGETEHRTFEDILDYMESGDTLILNNTKVLPARLYGQKENTGGQIEVLLLKNLGNDKWEALVRPGRRMKVGASVVFGGGILKGTVVDIVEDGNRIMEFEYDGIFNEILESLGEMPLPPYITEKLEDKDRYQTVYAEKEGSAAAPTAGLHFTEGLFEKIRAKGVNIGYVTLHVGLGTFRPVKADDIGDHTMHSEYFEISEDVAELVNETKRSGKKVIAVGTTSVRTLESSAVDKDRVEPQKRNTEIFIYPGYEFKIVDRIITNFHLPESTLIMLVSAMAGRENTLNAYREAISNRYRFFSFGDAMLIK